MNVATPLSATQRRLWAHCGAAPEVGAVVAVDVEGALDAAVLRRAFQWITDRHGALRTAVEVLNGAPRCRVAEAVEATVAVVDLRGLPPRDRPSAAVDRLAELSGRPIDPGDRSPVRLTAIRVDEDWHVLLLAAHRLFVDVRSLDILVEELWEAYGALAMGDAERLPPPLPCAGHVVPDPGTSGATPSTPPGEALGATGKPPLPTVRRATESATLPQALAAEIHTAAQRAGTSVFTFVVAAALLPDGPVQQQRTAIEVAVPGRSSPAFERAIGAFEDALPVPTGEPGHNGLRTLLTTVEQALGAAAGARAEGGSEHRVLVRHRPEVVLPAVAGLSASIVDPGRMTTGRLRELTVVDSESALTLTVSRDDDERGKDEARLMLADLEKGLAAAVAQVGRTVPVPSPIGFVDVPATRRDRQPTTLETMVAAVWADELDIDITDLDIDFFDLGGNSFQGAAVINRLRRTLGVDLPVSHIFSHPATVTRLAKAIEHLQQQDSGLSGRPPGTDEGL
ncbi:condensation domain-containing protein [Streptomyces lydicus]